MEITTQNTNNVTVITLSGRFDAYQSPSVTTQLDKSIGEGKVVVNLASVNFVDSSALATLVKGMKNCRQRGGDLHICSLQQPVRVIFELTRLDKAFRIFGSEAEAVNAFAS